MLVGIEAAHLGLRERAHEQETFRVRLGYRDDVERRQRIVRIRRRQFDDEPVGLVVVVVRPRVSRPDNDVVRIETTGALRLVRFERRLHRVFLDAERDAERTDVGRIVGDRDRDDLVVLEQHLSESVRHDVRGYVVRQRERRFRLRTAEDRVDLILRHPGVDAGLVAVRLRRLRPACDERCAQRASDRELDQQTAREPATAIIRLPERRHNDPVPDCAGAILLGKRLCGASCDGSQPDRCAPFGGAVKPR